MMKFSNIFVCQPLEQFEIFMMHDWVMLGLDFSFSTYARSVICSIMLCVFLFLIFPLKYARLVPSSLEIILESVYLFIVGLFRRNTSNYTSFYYFPLIFTVFLFVLFSNFLGLFPFSFTATSHLYTTFTLSFTLFFGIVILSFYNNKFNFVMFFIPSGVSNKPLLFFLVFIEIVSYLIRPFSLSIRLFANMLAGHTLLYILSNFCITLLHKGVVLVWVIPFILVFFVIVLEFFIAFIQAYVFVTLLVIYINDIYNVKH